MIAIPNFHLILVTFILIVDQVRSVIFPPTEVRSVFPPNLMIEAFDSKIPVFVGLAQLFQNTVFGNNSININIFTLITVVFINMAAGSR